MPGYRVLIIQEGPKDRIAQTRLFEGLGFLVDAVPDGSDAREAFFQNKPDMILADMSAPNFNPFEFLKMIEKSDIRTQIVFLSENPVLEDAVELMKQGALDYFVMPVDDEQLELSAKSVLAMKRDATREIPNRTPFSPIKIITRNLQMASIMDLAQRVADSTASVLIQGESGTGKELFAKFIHEKSRRHSHPFIAVNCAALPENLLESELFGHEKGAFTGAISSKMGKFELANNGTLFLDEITEMQVHLQAKLLRVLQEMKVDRVGGSHPIRVDVRIIATTNQNVHKAMEDGNFRQDLYYRLNTIPLVIPPLRERIDDLEVLCDYFVKKYSKIDARPVKGLTNGSVQILKNHMFSGNVRELENIIHRAVLLAREPQIKPEDLLLDMSDNAESSGSGSPAIPSSSPHDNPFPPSNSLKTPQSLKEMEQQMIYSTLDKTEGNRTHAAKILGISVRTLRNKLNEYRENAEV